MDERRQFFGITYKNGLHAEMPKIKCFLIDWLIHVCHVTLMSGEKGRSVCVNLIEGTLSQVTDIILEFAYGGK